MKRSNLIPLIIAVVPTTILFMVVLYNYYIVLDVEEIPIEVNVNENLGFDLNTTYLTFGTIPPGNSGSRSIRITNQEYNKAYVNIKIKGTLKNWIYVNENNFKMEKDELKELEFKILVPENAEKGTYQSKLRIITTRF
ncbi:MAG: hypothetical protein PHT54_00315 [Candidatus Nanoarchaeia archaeon]|nr:hypothetical protein [Candidatus Nanoarchaeia archaeon]